MSFWQNKKVLVTGGTGFLGSFVVERLKEKDCQDIFDSKIYDLRQLTEIKKMLTQFHPDIVIHLAARVGGIGANQMYPAELFYDNLIMGIQLFDESWRMGVEKFVSIGTVCAYPKVTPIPFKEVNLWNGYPEETNAPYGLAKKMLLVQGQAYRQQYDFNSIFLLPTNLYGPRDNFDLVSSHVIPALIRKCLETKQVIAWGTGLSTREFLYVKDAAEGILLAAEYYNDSMPVNLGSGTEISIKNLLALIVKLTHFEGEIAWDTSKPDGQPRRCLDTSFARKLFGFQSRTNIEEGLSCTIEWYKKQLGDIYQY